jgi:hypothetical protein
MKITLFIKNYSLLIIYVQMYKVLSNKKNKNKKNSIIYYRVFIFNQLFRNQHLLPFL